MRTRKQKVMLDFGAILIWVLVLLSLVSACSRGAYILFKSNSQPLFSFEYPSYYTVEEQAHTSSESVAVQIVRKVSGLKSLLYPTIDISAVTVESGANDIKSVMETHISNLARDPNVSNFQVLERNTISISGKNAEYAKYSYHGDGGTGMGKYVAFDSNGLIWTLNAVYSIDKSSELDPLFEHLLRTFKILD